MKLRGAERQSFRIGGGLLDCPLCGAIVVTTVLYQPLAETHLICDVHLKINKYRAVRYTYTRTHARTDAHKNARRVAGGRRGIRREGRFAGREGRSGRELCPMESIQSFGISLSLDIFDYAPAPPLHFL